MTNSNIYISKHLEIHESGETGDVYRLSYRIDGDVEDEGGIDAAIGEIRRGCDTLVRQLEECKEKKLDAALACINVLTLEMLDGERAAEER